MSRRIIRNVTWITNDNKPSEFDLLKSELSLIRKKEAKVWRDDYKSKYINRAKRKKRYKRTKNVLRDEVEALFQERSKKLESSLPKSEIWFRAKYEKEDINRQFKEKLFKDHYNDPVNRTYIPDVHNRGYKYIIEVDGSFHDRADQQLKDIKKDYYFRKRGYLVLRVKAYDEDSYNECIQKLKEHISYMNQVEAAKRRK